MNDTTTAAAANANTADGSNAAVSPSHETLLQKLEGEALQGYAHGLTVARDGIAHTSATVITTLTKWIGDAQAKLAGKQPAAPAGGGASSASDQAPTPGAAAFAAYSAAVGGVAVNGVALPAWPGLTPAVKAGWEAAAAAAVNHATASTQQQAAA